MSNRFFSKRKKRREKRGELDVSTKTRISPRIRLSASAFDKLEPNYEIKRVGKNLAIFENDKMTPVSKSAVEQMRHTIAMQQKPSKISVKGLSRAQIGRIAGDLAKGNGSDAISIRKLPSTREKSVNVQNYEIVIIKGFENNNEEKA